jgi:benzoylformate decarboxylase
VKGAPGLDLPSLDSAEIAAAYGVAARRLQEPGQLEEALRDAIASADPQLLEVRVAPGMAMA